MKALKCDQNQRQTLCRMQRSAVSRWRFVWFEIPLILSLCHTEKSVFFLTTWNMLKTGYQNDYHLPFLICRSQAVARSGCHPWYTWQLVAMNLSAGVVRKDPNAISINMNQSVVTEVIMNNKMITNIITLRE